MALLDGVEAAGTEEPAAVWLNHVSVELDGRLVLEDVSAAIPAGALVGIIGPNGAGKSTLLRVVAGLLKPSGGQVRIFSRPPGGWGETRHWTRYLPQNPVWDRRFPATALDVVIMGRLPALGHRITPQIRQEAYRSLEQVGMAALASRPIGELSGGQQQKVLLARALCSHARVLLLDEPNTGLDPLAEQEFFALLQELVRSRRLTTLVVSHDLAAMGTQADLLLFLNRTVRGFGNPEAVLQAYAREHAAAHPWLAGVAASAGHSGSRRGGSL